MIEQYVANLADRIRLCEVTLYGSNRDFANPERDIDLFILAEGLSEYASDCAGQLDVVLLPVEEARMRARLLDPLVTEPALTGRTVFGQRVVDPMELERSAEAKSVAAQHLVERGAEVLKWTDESLGDAIHIEAIGDQGLLDRILRNASYAASYLTFSSWYRDGGRLITLQELVEEFPRGLLAQVQRLRAIHPRSAPATSGVLASLRRALTDWPEPGSNLIICLCL
jgi:hypothetical protein